MVGKEKRQARAKDRKRRVPIRSGKRTDFSRRAELSPKHVRDDVFLYGRERQATSGQADRHASWIRILQLWGSETTLETLQFACRDRRSGGCCCESRGKAAGRHQGLGAGGRRAVLSSYARALVPRGPNLDDGISLSRVGAGSCDRH